MADAGAADQDELLSRRTRAEGLGEPEQALDRDVHDKSGTSLQVARCTTWLTPSMARSTLSRSEIVPFTNSSPGAAESVRLWQSARMIRSGRGDKLSRRIRFDPTFPVAPVIRSFIVFLQPLNFVESDCQRAVKATGNNKRLTARADIGTFVMLSDKRFSAPSGLRA